MSFSIIRERWNKFQVTSPKNDISGVVSSPEYKIGAAAIFQLSIKTEYDRNASTNYTPKFNTKIFLKFFKVRPDNPRSCIIKLTSSDMDLDKILKRHFHDDSEIPLIIFDDIRSTCIWEFTLSITMETVSKMIIFASIFDDSELTDFQLKGQDGSIEFHKTVLAGHSHVFRRMLCGKWKEGKQGIMELPEVRRSTLQQLKEYMYLGKLPDEGLEEILVLASTYRICELEYRICELIMNNICNENALDTLRFAMQNNITKLTIDIIICSNLGVISGEKMELLYDLERPLTLDDD